jgi:hypothetical protein
MSDPQLYVEKSHKSILSKRIFFTDVNFGIYNYSVVLFYLKHCKQLPLFLSQFWAIL